MDEIKYFRKMKKKGFLVACFIAALISAKSQVAAQARLQSYDVVIYGYMEGLPVELWPPSRPQG